MKLKQLINDHYNSDDNLAAEACSTTVETLRNWKCQDREVLALADGRFILKSSKTIIFKVTNQLRGDRK